MSGRTGYLVAPPSGEGPAVLVLHSWWGMTPWVRRLADRLADAGFVALVPDLADGELPATEDEAQAALRVRDPNQVADLVVSSAATLRSLTITPDAGIGVIGFSMGASWALWLASRQPALVRAVSAFYGTQTVGYEDAEAAFQLHVAELDPIVSEDDVALLEATLLLDARPVEVHRYPGVGHWFMEADRPGHHDAGTAELAWERTVEFLRRELSEATDQSG